MTLNEQLKAEIDRLLDYDPKTGQFHWTFSRGGRRAGTLAGSIDNKGYRTIRINRVLYKAHRLVWLIHTGDMPEIVDHKDHERDNNKYSNLRASDVATNNANMDIRSDNKSGFKGVSLHRGSKKWVAKLRGKTLGYFATPKLASKAYVKEAKKAFGKFYNDTTSQNPTRRRY